MIYDKIVNIEKYNGLSKWFHDAVDFLRTTDLASLPLGQTEIKGNHVFVNVMEVDTKNAEDISFEFHKKYWDIHIDIEGMEKLQIGLDQGNAVDAFREEDDFGTISVSKWMEYLVEPGCFIVCMQEEPHKPALRYNDFARIKKCVIKVEAEEYE